MNRIVKGLLIGVPALLVTAGVCVAGLAQWRLGHVYDEPLVEIAAPVTADKAEEGARLARVLGCSGCHGESGRVLFEAPNVGRLIAPNLTRVAANYSDAELARLIRKGVKRDGTSVLVMPTAALTHIADDDLAAVISWLRAQPTLPDGAADGTHWGALGMIGLALNKLPLGADALHDPAPPAARIRNAKIDEGRYLVSVTCRACHALHDTTDDGFGMVTPPLADTVRSYQPDEFQTLLTTGKAPGNREVGFMSEIARADSSAMTEDERASVYAYLLSDQADADE